MATKSATGLLRNLWRRVDKFFSVDINPDPVFLADFRGSQAQKEVNSWRLFSDSIFGGLSTGTLAPSSEGAVFSGRVSKRVKEDSTLVRSGYVGINKLLPAPLDLSLHDTLEFRVRSRDGHTYVASLRADQYTGGDEEAWQAPLRPKGTGEWEDVRVPLDQLIFTFRGRLVERQSSFAEMPRHNVMAVGITMAADESMQVEEDFSLEISHVVAKADALEGAAAARKMYKGLGYSHDDDQDDSWRRSHNPQQQQPSYFGQHPDSEAGASGQQGSHQHDGLGALGGRKARRLGVGGPLPTPSSSALSQSQPSESQCQTGSLEGVQGVSADSSSSGKQEGRTS